MRLSKSSLAWHKLLASHGQICLLAAPWFFPRGDEESRPQEIQGSKHERHVDGSVWFSGIRFRSLKTTANKKLRTLEALHQGKPNVLIIASPECCMQHYAARVLKHLEVQDLIQICIEDSVFFQKQLNLPITAALTMKRFTSVTR